MFKPIVGVIGTSDTMERPSRFNSWARKTCGPCAMWQCPSAHVCRPPACDRYRIIARCRRWRVAHGARANVHPTFFNVEPNEKHEPYDKDRDQVALELTRACVAKGTPIFGVCRGIQEMNVAFGGTLHPEIRELPGRMNHRAPRLENGDVHPDPEMCLPTGMKSTSSGGVFANLYGTEQIHVNSLHGQGIEVPGERVVVEGVAEDSTIEAIRINGASGFALGVQWHAEYDPQTKSNQSGAV